MVGSDDATDAASCFFSTDQFDLLQTIGTGSFARVRLVRDRRNGRFYALKVMQKAHLLKLKQIEHILNERAILRDFHSPRIANLSQTPVLLLTAPSLRRGTFQDSAHVYMLLEYVPGGELFFHLRSAGRFPVSTVRFYVAALTLILADLHAHDVVYRDLKPENVLLDKTGYPRLTDFGFAKRVRERTWTLCGTPEYLAPEVIQSRGHGVAVDFWSLGVLFYELALGYPPFTDDNPFVIYQQILDGRVTFPKNIDPWAKDLMRRLLNGDQSKRIGNLYHGIDDIKKHRFFKGFDWVALETGTMHAPIVPKIKSACDTSYFDQYAEAPATEESGVDLTEADALLQAF